MSEFNKCAHLCNTHDLRVAEELYDDLLSKGQDPLQYLLTLQNTLQERLAKQHGRVKAPLQIVTKGELYDFIHDQKVAFDDEFRELVEAIAGMSLPEKDRSAIWKKWKGKYESLRGEEVASLSEEDRLELLFEIIDAAHFFNNMLLALGVDARTLFVMYALKNSENLVRQDSGY